MAIDWLEWNAAGSLSDEVDTVLRSSIGSYWNGWKVGYASGHWSYRLKDHDTGAVVLCNRQSAQIRLTGEPLTVVGAERLVDAVKARLVSLGAYAHNDYPTRCDVALDYSGLAPQYPVRFSTGRTGRSPRPTVHGHDCDTGLYETLTVGRAGNDGAALILQIYNKTLELTRPDVHGAEYGERLMADWVSNGYVDGTVYRFEVRAQRARLVANNLTLATCLSQSLSVLALGLAWLTPSDDAGTVALWRIAATEAAGVLPLTLRAPTRRVGAPSSDGVIMDFTRVVCRYMAIHGLDTPTDAVGVMLYALDCLSASGEVDVPALVKQYAHRYHKGVTVNAPLDTEVSAHQAESKQEAELSIF